ncbi:hypothetical protein EDB80DRAFT_685880 [Ilyonectria destructans]|nr:hypothetical protein EDB80DRAFT_685880 [Ilyonectria destructans]
MIQYDFFQDADVWQNAPIMTGSTKFKPRADAKNIMVTGGAGFMRGTLCIVVSSLQLSPRRRHNPVEVVDCLERYQIDTIFHFAAQSHVDLSFGNSYGFTYNNTYGTHVLLESAKKVGSKRLIHISTDEVYGEVKGDDDDLLEGSILASTNPYAASKAAAEMMIMFFFMASSTRNAGILSSETCGTGASMMTPINRRAMPPPPLSRVDGEIGLARDAERAVDGPADVKPVGPRVVLRDDKGAVVAADGHDPVGSPSPEPIVQGETAGEMAALVNDL